jgi:hypothetical protein
MKTITSPVKRFPGTVTIPDALTFPQAIAWEKAGIAASALKANPEATDAEYWQAWMPGITAVVETWNLTGFDPQKPPATPRLSIAQLVSWLVGEISTLYTEADEVPNE